MLQAWESECCQMQRGHPIARRALTIILLSHLSGLLRNHPKSLPLPGLEMELILPLEMTTDRSRSGMLRQTPS